MSLMKTAEEALCVIMEARKRASEEPSKCCLMAVREDQLEIISKALYEYICKHGNSLSGERNEGEGTTTISYGEPVLSGRLDALIGVSKYLRRDVDSFAQKINDFLDVLEEARW